MALKQTVDHMKHLLSQITTDIGKAENGNKAASQRVRTGTIKLEKIAKVYRKESIVHDKSTKGRKKAPAKKTAKAPAKKHIVKAPPKAAKKATAAKKPAASSRPMMPKKRSQTAKLPSRKS